MKRTFTKLTFSILLPSLLFLLPHPLAPHLSLPPLFFLFCLHLISPPTFSSSSISFVSFTPPLLSSIYSSLHSSLRHNVSLSELPAETKWITSLSWLHHPADVIDSVVYTLVGVQSSCKEFSELRFWQISQPVNLPMHANPSCYLLLPAAVIQQELGVTRCILF